MSNPQLENGYLRISTELWDHICKTRIRGEYRQMFDFIIRKTYGFRKTEDRISTSQFIKNTSLTRNAVHKARRWLKEMKMITVSQKGDDYILTYSINKRYKEWKVCPKKATVSHKATRCIPKRSRGVSQKGSPYMTKDNTTKDNITKDIAHFEMLWLRYPKKLGKDKALEYYLKFVKTEKDRNDIEIALKNYCKTENVILKQARYIQHASTWFNKRWRDFIDYKEIGVSNAESKKRWL